MIHCHLMSAFSPILAGKHIFSIMPPWCFPVHVPTVGNVSPQKACPYFTNINQHICTRLSRCKCGEAPCSEEHVSTACPSCTVMREKGAVWGQDFPLGSHPRLPLDSHTLKLTVNERTPLRSLLWGSLATLAETHQPQKAAVLLPQWKHTVAPLGNATDRPANSNIGTL